MTTTTAPRTVTVRALERLSEYRAVEDLQRRIWGSGDVGGSSLVDMLTANSAGGIVIGAFDEDEIVGFVFSILGIDAQHTLRQASILMGVAPERRGERIGYRLKQAQRDATLAMGISSITWTFDPLAAVNAELNAGQLGATSREYLVDYYGPADGLNAGLPTDRLLVSWDLRRSGDRVSSIDAAPAASVVRHDASGYPLIGRILETECAPRVLVPIPADIQAMKSHDLGMALDWRFANREMLIDRFEGGYEVVGFSPLNESLGVPAYILERAP